MFAKSTDKGQSQGNISYIIAKYCIVICINMIYGFVKHLLASHNYLLKIAAANDRRPVIDTPLIE